MVGDGNRQAKGDSAMMVDGRGTSSSNNGVRGENQVTANVLIVEKRDL